METSSGQVSKRKADARNGLLAIIVAFILVIAFFVAHQAWSTGFFTSSFGPLETLLFYCALVLGFTYPLGIPAALRQRLGRRTELTYEISTAVFWTVTAAWLLLVFPLNFPQIAAVVPGPFKFLLSWITNDIGRVLLEIALVGALAFIPFYAFQFRTASRKRAISGPA